MSPAPALEHALAALRSRPAAVVLVDGRSGSGKTTFAAVLARRGRAALLRLEDVYPGWDGLDAASAALVDRVLVPRSSGVPGSLGEWDWSGAGIVGTRIVLPAGPLVVEGCGALSRRAARTAALRLWVSLPDPERRSRALARDGADYAAQWERWARQERAFAAREQPRPLADLVVDGRGFPQPLFSDRPALAH